MITEGFVARDLRSGCRELFENVGEETIVQMDVDRFSDVLRTGSLKDQRNAADIKLGVKLGRVLERPAIEFVGYSSAPPLSAIGLLISFCILGVLIYPLACFPLAVIELDHSWAEDW